MIYIFTGYFYRFSNYAIDKDTIIISRKKSILNDDIIYGDFEEILIKYISQIIVYEA